MSAWSRAPELEDPRMRQDRPRDAHVEPLASIAVMDAGAVRP